VHGVAHAVARTAVPNAEFLAGATEKEMVVCILEVDLQQVVIDALGGKLGLDAAKGS
jgi:hypothetical protein